MNAIHSLWTKPFFVRGGGDFFMEDFELLTMLLSALVWRKNGGKITMVTDTAGKSYLLSRGLEPLWDGGIDSVLDEAVPASLDPFLFWAGGKLCALNSRREPTCMIDTDLIVWRECASLEGKEIVAAHREKISPEIYPDKAVFCMKSSYSFPDWDWSVLPCNTAFLYIKDLAFRDYYVKRSLEFMLGLERGDSVVIPMVFAEQRLLSMCAKEKDKPISTLAELDGLKSQRDLTHVWGHKGVLRSDPKRRAEYCRRCISRIKRDFPDYGAMLKGVPEVFAHLWECE